jgi:hypothetical protein
MGSKCKLRRKLTANLKSENFFFHPHISSYFSFSSLTIPIFSKYFYFGSESYFANISIPKLERDKRKLPENDKKKKDCRFDHFLATKVFTPVINRFNSIRKV